MYDKLDQKTEKTLKEKTKEQSLDNPLREFRFPSEKEETECITDPRGAEVLLLHKIVENWGNPSTPLPAMVGWLQGYAADEWKQTEELSVFMLRERVKELTARVKEYKIKHHHARLNRFTIEKMYKDIQKANTILKEENGRTVNLLKLAGGKIAELENVLSAANWERDAFLKKANELELEKDKLVKEWKVWEKNWNRDNGEPDNTRAVIGRLDRTLQDVNKRLMMLEKIGSRFHAKKIADFNTVSAPAATDGSAAQPGENVKQNTDYRDLYHRTLNELHIQQANYAKAVDVLNEKIRAVEFWENEAKVLQSAYNILTKTNEKLEKQVYESMPLGSFQDIAQLVQKHVNDTINVLHGTKAGNGQGPANAGNGTADPARKG